MATREPFFAILDAGWRNTNVRRSAIPTILNTSPLPGPLRTFAKRTSCELRQPVVMIPVMRISCASAPNELNDAAWRDLYQFGETHLTARCLAILMTEGLRDVVHRGDRVPLLPPPMETQECGADDAPWTMFVSQKLRVKSVCSRQRRVLRTMACVLHPRRWMRATDALKRSFEGPCLRRCELSLGNTPDCHSDKWTQRQ